MRLETEAEIVEIQAADIEREPSGEVISIVPGYLRISGRLVPVTIEEVCHPQMKFIGDERHGSQASTEERSYFCLLIVRQAIDQG
jgi:hypothetical protein